MPKGSKERSKARKDEIIQTCSDLYETMSFKEITLQEIGKKTTFSRTLIYYYFHTKEEIFLALLQREYEAWIVDLDTIRQTHSNMTCHAFAQALALSLEQRKNLLKLLSMNHYDMEAASRMDNLIDFKKTYAETLTAVQACLEHFFPSMKEEDIQNFLYAFFPFLFGIYPYTVVTEKQKESMEQAHVHHVYLSIYEITYNMVMKLLQGIAS